jgi:hypothetical protein
LFIQNVSFECFTMGQYWSGYFTYTTWHHARIPSLLLCLPVEILHLISEQLYTIPEFFFAFALTCKTLHSILMPQAPVLGPLALDALLVLLEKDAGVGNKFYFCPICHRLHRFSMGWGPTTREHTMHEPEFRYRRMCYADTSFDLGCAHYSLGYHHARLVMNRHLYGTPCGLPLHNLQAVSMRAFTAPYGVQDWSARVIDDELYLCAMHTMNGSSVPGHVLRSVIDRSYTYFICTHVQPSHDISALKKPRASSSEAGEPFPECQGVFGSCSWCLTEYQTTIEKKRPP